MLKHYAGSLLSLSLMLGGLPAWTLDDQAQPGASQQSATRPTGLEEVVVTAQRRAQRLLDVPASLAVVSGEAMAAAHISSLVNLQEITPSLLVTQTWSPTNGNFTLRGVGTSGVFFEQAVGVYIDGVYRSRSGAALGELLDVDRVEILRGPQSTLFGRNNAVGAINIATRLPDTEQFAAFVEGGYGNYDRRQGSGSVNLPLIQDTLAMNLAVAVNGIHDGVVDANFLPDGNVNALDRKSSRLQLLWTPTPLTSVRMIADYAEGNHRCCSYIPRFISDADGQGSGTLVGYTPPTEPERGELYTTPGTFYAPFERNSTQGNVSEFDDKDTGLSVQFDHDIDDMTLTAIAASRQYNTDANLDLDGTNSPKTNVQSLPVEKNKESSVELRLQNASGSTLEWLAGLYYFDQELTNVTILPFTASGTTLNIFDSTGTGTTESASVFGQTTYSLTDKWQLTGGLRYLYETKDGDVAVVPSPVNRTYPGNATIDGDELMGTTTLAYAPDDYSNYYARYARGYKSGGINLLLTKPDTPETPMTVDPETSDAYEVGAKLRLLDDCLSANLAVYTQDYKDLQVQTFDGATFLTLNAAKLRSRGIEAELLFRPVEPLTLTQGFNYLDAEYLSFPNAPLPAGTPTGGKSQFQDLSGESPSNAPEWTVIGGANYAYPLSPTMTLIANTNVRYATDYYTDLANTPAFENESTTIVGASLALQFESGLAVMLWGSNLTDEDVILSGIVTPSAPTSVSIFPGTPMMYGVTVSYRY